MAYTVICELGKRDAGAYPVKLTFANGIVFKRQITDPDLNRLREISFRPGSATDDVAAACFEQLFGGAEKPLDEAIAKGDAEADGLTRVLLQVSPRRSDLDHVPWQLAALGRPGPPAFEIVRSFATVPGLASAMPSLPFRVLVGNMGLPHEATPTFPLRSVLLNIFGPAERLTRIFHPSTVAGLDRDELAGLLAASRYDIVHLQVLTDWLQHREAMIDAPGDGAPLVATTLLPLLQRARTRLLILQLRDSAHGIPEAAQLCELAAAIVEGGGPAVLVVPFDPPGPGPGSPILNTIYEQIVHDRPLDEAVHAARLQTYQPQAAPPVAAVAQPMLYLGTGGENLLRVSPLALDLQKRTDATRDFAALLSRRMQRLSSQTRLDLTLPTDVLANANLNFDTARQTIDRIQSWNRERDGLVPLHEATIAAEAGQRELRDAASHLERIEEKAARVVNLCVLRDAKVVAPEEVLLRGTFYELRVQIGQRWQHDSIVANPRGLPEKFIAEHAEADGGILLDVCLYSDDVTFSKGDIFALRLPKAPASSAQLDVVFKPIKEGNARLRVCIYFRQNLLQSLMVVTTVGQAGGSAPEPARAEIEFTMDDALLDVERLPPRSLNILTNDSGDGTHKIAIRATDIKLQYTLQGSAAIGRIRTTLLAICADVDKDGNPVAYHYSDDDNSGDEAKLVADLKQLADVGKNLYADLITDPANWSVEDPLEQALRQSATIQVSITSSANNIYPWALLYDRKLESGPGIDVCPVMLQKLQQATPAALLQTHSCMDGGCPHAADIKTVCPLGFWGFRHAIEQLPPNQGTLVDTIQTHKAPSFVMAVHQQLKGKQHRVEIEKAAGFAVDYQDLRANISNALKSQRPHVVYFYCHGGHNDNAPWLGVGAGEQIVPGDFRAWDTRWQDTNPIVIVNGCHTVDLSPNDLLNFVKIFAWCRAAGVIGTEIAIPESLAQEFGRFFIERLIKGDKVGEIFRDFRLSLLAKRNVLGLAYTPYCHGDLHLN